MKERFGLSRSGGQDAEYGSFSSLWWSVARGLEAAASWEVHHRSFVWSRCLVFCTVTGGWRFYLLHSETHEAKVS